MEWRLEPPPLTARRHCLYLIMSLVEVTLVLLRQAARGPSEHMIWRPFQVKKNHWPTWEETGSTSSRPSFRSPTAWGPACGRQDKAAETRDWAGDPQIFSLMLSQLGYRGSPKLGCQTHRQITAPAIPGSPRIHRCRRCGRGPIPGWCVVTRVFNWAWALGAVARIGPGWFREFSTIRPSNLKSSRPRFGNVLCVLGAVHTAQACF